MAVSSFSSYDRSVPIVSDDSVLSSQNHRFPARGTSAAAPLPRQHLDDADLLTLQRQHGNAGFRDDNNMSNSVDDLTQLTDRMPYQTTTFGQGFSDPDDDELHFDNGSGYDYEVAIQERLKRANEVFEHDKTPVEFTHPQRVSFDAVVKAVDIVQDPDDDVTKTSSSPPAVSPVAKESATASGASSQGESSPHEYTVPLNDTQPKEGPTLIQQIKAMQLHGGPTVGGDRRFASSTYTPNGSSSQTENASPSKSNANSHLNTPKSTDGTEKPPSSVVSTAVLVSKNGRFELQGEDDYTARQSINDSDSDTDDDNDGNSAARPSTQAKQRADSHKSESLPRPQASATRPKSSDSGKRTDNRSNGAKSSSTSYHRNKSPGTNQQRAKSAGVSSSIESFIIKPSSVDFDELNRKAAERKRAELQEERRKKEKADAKRKEDDAKAKESYKQWLQDKDAERRRINEEKRLEQEEEKTRQVKCEKELDEEREKKYKEWVERKNHEVMMANEFRKLQGNEEDMKLAGSSSSIHNANRQEDHRAFRRWLRKKNEQCKEERRQLQLETRRLRRHQRRSMKHFQLQRDLQLAKSFGYT